MNHFTSESVNTTTADISLIEDIQLGTSGAIEKLYDTYACLLLGLISKIITDEKISGDVLQKTFLRIVEEIKACHSSQTGFLIWMLTIARNTALETVKHMEEKQNAGIRAANSFVNAFDLIYLKGYSYAAVAEQLDIPVSDLKIKIRTELKNLNRVVIK